MLILLLGYWLNGYGWATEAESFGKGAPCSRGLAFVAEEHPFTGVDVKMLRFIAEGAVDDDLA